MWLVFGHGPNSIVLQHLLSGLRFLRSFAAEQPVEACENGSHENARQRRAESEEDWAADPIRYFSGRFLKF